MIIQIKKWFKLRKLKFELAKIGEEHKNIMRSQEYQKADKDVRNGMIADMEFEWREIYEQVESIKTKKILKIAHKYKIPIPPQWPIEDNCYWEQGDFGECYLTSEGYNKIKKEIHAEKKAIWEERFLWIPVLSIVGAIVATFTSFYVVANYQLNESVNVAEVGVNIDNAANLVVLKNYGKLPANKFNLIGIQVEFGEKPTEIATFKAGTDTIYSNEDLLFPPKIVAGNCDKHAQFLICMWSYNNGRKNVTKNRIFVRTPSEPYWVPTIRSFVNINQWNDLSNRVNKIKKEFITLRENGVRP